MIVVAKTLMVCYSWTWTNILLYVPYAVNTANTACRYGPIPRLRISIRMEYPVRISIRMEYPVRISIRMECPVRISIRIEYPDKKWNKLNNVGAILFVRISFRINIVHKQRAYRIAQWAILSACGWHTDGIVQNHEILTGSCSAILPKGLYLYNQKWSLLFKLLSCVKL